MPSIEITEATGVAVPNAAAAFTMCVVGASSSNPVSAGSMSPCYSSQGQALNDFGIGDAPDALRQAITQTPGNPNPPPAAFYSTPATTPGVRGTPSTSGIVGGSCVPVQTASTHPLGTYEPVFNVVDDGNGGLGTAIGTAGIVLRASLDNGRTWLPTYQLGTATTTSAKLNGVDTGVQWDLDAASPTALYTGLNALRTAELAHFLNVSGSPAVHAAADTTDNTALTAVPTATTPATAVALFNALRTLLATHVASAVYHTVADTVAEAAIAALHAAVDIEDANLQLAALTAAYNAHRVLVGAGPVHGSADATNTCAAYTVSAATLFTGDTWGETRTTPPMWADADLYAAGTPSTGAFAAIASSATQIGIVVITEPVAVGDFATIVAGMDHCLGYGKKPWVIIRFRDPMINEADSAYVTAFKAFAAACSDDRVTCVAGNGWLTDATFGFVYWRSGLPAVLARLQSFQGRSGQRITRSPGYVNDGALEGFSLVDSNGKLLSGAHDENVIGGISDDPNPIAGGGGGLTFYRIPNPNYSGAYVWNCPVLYAPDGEILTGMDRRIASTVEALAASVAWSMIQGGDNVDPTTNLIAPDLQDAIQAAIDTPIAKQYSAEFPNATDPNLVTINQPATVSGANVAISGTVAMQLFGYTDKITLNFSATR